MRIGILSVAHLHVDAYLDALRTVPDVEIVGVADHDAARARRWADTRGVRLHDSYDDLLGEGLDGVVVCSENADHRGIVELAAGAGAGVLCEKPLATTAADARAIVDVCERAGVGLMTAFPMRFSAPMRAVADVVHDGRLGRVHAVTGTNRGELPMRHRSWFTDPRLAGGGAFMDHVVHVVDVLRWYLGQEPAEVYAVANRLLHGEVVSVETGGLVSIAFTGGTYATIDCSWSRPESYPTWGGLTLELVGDGGVVSVDPFRQRLEVFTDNGAPLRWPEWGSDANRAMIEDFTAMIRDRRAPTVSGHDGLVATEVALACYRSDATGQPVTVEVTS